MRLLFIAVFCCCVTASKAESYVGSHSRLVPDWTLVLPAIVHGKPFVYAGSAVEIVDIHADGVATLPKPGGVARIISSSYPDAVDGTAYELSAARISVSRWKDGKNAGGALLEYSVPCTATIIVIRYVVHVADGGSSGVLTMTSYEVSALSR